MTSREAAARVGLIATVSVIVVISTLSPLLRQPSRSNDTRTVVAFAAPLTIPEGNPGGPAATQAGDRTPQISSPPASDFGATDAPALVMPAPHLLSASSPPLSLVTQRRPTEGSALATTQLSAESSQVVPVAPVPEPPRAEQDAKSRYSKGMVRSRPAPFFHNEQIASHWAYHRAPVAPPRSTPFSYNKQLAPQSN
jgi:hypothetical protein